VGAGHEQDIYSVCYAPNGEFIATGSIDRTVRLWHEKVGDNMRMKEMVKLTTPAGLNCVTLTRDSEYIIAVSFDKCCLVYSTRTGHLMTRLANVDLAAYGIAASLNGYVNPTDKSARLKQLITF
jgi:WD40 repeat protein